MKIRVKGHDHTPFYNRQLYNLSILGLSHATLPCMAGIIALIPQKPRR
jgi:hypothetical protein